MHIVALLDPDNSLYLPIAQILPADQFSLIDCRNLPELLDQQNHAKIDLAIIAWSPNCPDNLAAIREINAAAPDIQPLVLGHDLDRKTTVAIMQQNAADVLEYPCAGPVLLDCAISNIAAAKARAIRKKADLDKLFADMENQQLLNWRAMYASKEVVQTEHLIHEMATTINSTGGYEWLDLLQAMSQPGEAGQVVVPKEIFDLVIESASSQRKYFDFVTFLSRLDKMAINKAEQGAVQFCVDVQALLHKLLDLLCGRYNRPFKTSFPEAETWISGYVCQDMSILERCLRELIINAIKYSPEGSTIVAGLEADGNAKLPVLNLWIRNQPREYQAKDSGGTQIVGIPREYSELVFDLFYTIEPYPNKVPEEEWTDGAGLFIARKLLKHQGAWLGCANGVDYSNFSADPFIKFNIALPLHVKRDTRHCNPKCSPCPFALVKNHSTGNS